MKATLKGNGMGSYKIKKFNPLKDANFDLVIFKNGYPHCSKHGAMNKITKDEFGGGYWRCIHVPSNQNENTCRAGCIEKRNG